MYNKTIMQTPIQISLEDETRMEQLIQIMKLKTILHANDRQMLITNMRLTFNHRQKWIRETKPAISITDIIEKYPKFLSEDYLVCSCEI